MTTQPMDTRNRGRIAAAAPGDLHYSTIPPNLTEPERFAYLRGFDAADRKLIRNGDGPAIVHTDGKAPEPGTAAFRMMANAAAESARAYRITRHPIAHAAGMRAIGTYLRKIDKLSAERARLHGTDHTPTAPVRLAAITGEPVKVTRTRKPAVSRQSFETATEPAPVTPDVPAAVDTADNGAVADDVVTVARATGRLTVVTVTDHPADTPESVAVAEPVAPLVGSLSTPEPAPAWAPGQGTRREARRKLAADMRARGETPTGDAWVAACLAAGIPTRTDTGTVTA